MNIDFNRIVKSHLKNYDLGASILSLLLISLYGLGLIAGDIVIDQLYVFRRKAGLLILFIIATFLYLILYNAFHVFFDNIDRINRKKINIKLMDSVVSPLVLNNMIILLCGWIPYLIIRFPGNVDIDSLTQVLQFYGYFPLGDAHPLFDSALFALFWKIGDILGSNMWSVLLYAIGQMVMTSFIMAVVIDYANRFGPSKRILAFLYAFYAFYPVIPLFAQTMAKDMLHGWIFLLFALIYTDIVRMNGECLGDRNEFLLLAITLLGVDLTKKTGCYVLVLAMAFLIVYVKKNRIRLLLITVSVLFFHFIVWSHVLLPIWGVKGQNTVEMWSVVSQQVAYIIREDDSLEEEDYIILNSVYDRLHEMPDDYNPVRTDSSHSHWRSNCSKKDKTIFLKWYITQYKERPKEMLLALFAQDYPLLVVDTYSAEDESCIFYRDNIPEKTDEVGAGYEQTFADWSGTGDVKGLHEILASSYRPSIVKELSNAYNSLYLHIMSIVPVFFSKVLFATWIPLFILFYSIHSRRLNIAVALVPELIMTAVLAVGPIVIPRYMVATVYCCPLVILLPLIMSSTENNL